MIAPAEIEKAHQKIAPFVHRTPVFTSRILNEKSGVSLFFKCENLQKVGAFKARGAMHAVLNLSAAEKAMGVATHSSGNHGQALAWAAQQQGIKAFVVMPDNAPKVKVEAVKNYGAKVHFCAPNLAARESTLAEVVAKTGATFVHPYNNRNVILGQATAAKELLEEAPELNAIIAPVGGGGLMSGTALSAKFFGKNVHAFGAEPQNADDAKRSFDAQELIPSINPNTIADGLKTSLGDLTFPLILENVQDIFTVSEVEILSAMKLVWQHLKIVVEPSAAVPLAVVLKEKDWFANQNVGIIFSGGNVDLNTFFSSAS